MISCATIVRWGIAMIFFSAACITAFKGGFPIGPVTTLSAYIISGLLYFILVMLGMGWLIITDD